MRSEAETEATLEAPNIESFRSLDQPARERFRLLSRAMEPRNAYSSRGTCGSQIHPPQTALGQRFLTQCNLARGDCVH